MPLNSTVENFQQMFNILVWKYRQEYLNIQLFAFFLSAENSIESKRVELL